MIKVQWVFLKGRFQNIQSHFLDSGCVHTKSEAANKTVCFPFKCNYVAHGPAVMVVGATCDDSVQICLAPEIKPSSTCSVYHSGAANHVSRESDISVTQQTTQVNGGILQNQILA